MFLKLNKNKLSCFYVYNCLLIKYFKPGSAEYFFFKAPSSFFPGQRGVRCSARGPEQPPGERREAGG